MLYASERSLFNSLYQSIDFQHLISVAHYLSAYVEFE